MLSATGFSGNECAPELDLSTVGPQTVRVGETLTLDLPALGATLVDLDSGGQPTGDALRWLADPDTGVDFPTGATLTDAGVFTWTPTGSQTGQFSVLIIGVDGGTPALADSEVLTITVGAQTNNIAPSLSLTGIIDDDFAGTFTEDGGPVPIVGVGVVPSDAGRVLRLSDPDSATLGPVTVTLTNPLDGAAESLSANVEGLPLTSVYDPNTGVLTVSGAGSSSTYQRVLRSLTYNNTSQSPNTADRIITVKISDGEDDSPTRTSTISVIAQPDAPDLAPIDDQQVVVNNQLVVPVTATEVDAGDTLTFTLDPNNSPADATIVKTGDTTAEVRWTPTTETFPGSVGFTVVVTDDAAVPRSDAETFDVVVHPVNVAPNLASISDRSGTVGVQLVIPVSATDANNGQTLTLSLDPSNSPATATLIDNGDGTGEIRWTPEAGDAGATVDFGVLVTDNGLAPLVDGETFSVSVSA